MARLGDPSAAKAEVGSDLESVRANFNEIVQISLGL